MNIQQRKYVCDRTDTIIQDAVEKLQKNKKKLGGYRFEENQVKKGILSGKLHLVSEDVLLSRLHVTNSLSYHVFISENIEEYVSQLKKTLELENRKYDHAVEKLYQLRTEIKDKIMIGNSNEALDELHQLPILIKAIISSVELNAVS